MTCQHTNTVHHATYPSGEPGIWHVHRNCTDCGTTLTTPKARGDIDMIDIVHALERWLRRGTPGGRRIECFAANSHDVAVQLHYGYGRLTTTSVGDLSEGIAMALEEACS